MASRFTASLANLSESTSLTSNARRLRTLWRESFLLVLSGLVFLWNLGNNGWGNPYYAAAAQAASLDWTSFLFASADSGNGLTIDKPPLHIWVLAASVKLFGLSHISVLAPQAIMGMLTVLLVYKTVAAYSSTRQALQSALFVILIPVSAIIFRFNNPDALMLLLWAITAFMFVKYAHGTNMRHLFAAALFLGLAFLCKQFQAWAIVPALVAAVMVFDAGKLLFKLKRLCIAAGLMLLPPAAWVVATILTPPLQRPWIGGTKTNSFLELTFGYNGLGRLTGHEEFGAENPSGFEGVVGYDAGILRLLSINYAPEVAWFLPVAFVGAINLSWKLLRRRLHRPKSMAMLFMVVWFVTVFCILSFMTGDIHPYYTSMLVIPMAVISSHATEACWENRAKAWHMRWAALTALATMLVALGISTWYEGWQPWAGNVVRLLAISAAAVWGIWPGPYRPKLTGAGFFFAGSSLLLLPMLFTVESIHTPQQGSFPISGPVPTVESWHRRDAEQLRLNEQDKYSMARGEPVIQDIVALLKPSRSTARWAAATTGSENAALYQISSGRPVLSIGGFSTADVFPQIDDFKQFVAQGQIAFYIHQPGILNWANSSANTKDVVAWIQANFVYEDVDGVRVYDLARPAA